MPTPETTVANLGEDRLIELMQRHLSPADATLLLPAGDDAAIVRLPDALPLEVMSTDLLIEGTHFLANESTDWYRLGRRALVANLSDLAAMGAVPGSALISIGLPPQFLSRNLEALYQGLADEAARFELRLVGGDTVRSPHVVINVAITGYKAAGEARCSRANCRVGDYLYVSGALGGCRAGLEILLSGRQAEQLSNAEVALLERQQLPVPRIELGRQLATQLDRVAMMDVSDGLFTDLTRMAKASGVGFELQLERIPLYPGVADFYSEAGKDALEMALFSGEEFELLFATDLAPDALAKRMESPCAVTCVGRAVKGPGVVALNEAGQPVPIHDIGFHHFDTV